jgi:hypothetical protein
MKLNTGWSSSIYKNLKFSKALSLWVDMRILDLKVYFTNVTAPVSIGAMWLMLHGKGWRGNCEYVAERYWFRYHLLELSPLYAGNFRLEIVKNNELTFCNVEIQQIFKGYLEGLVTIPELQIKHNYGFNDVDDMFYLTFPRFQPFRNSKESQVHHRTKEGYKLAGLIILFQ